MKANLLRTASITAAFRSVALGGFLAVGLSCALGAVVIDVPGQANIYGAGHTTAPGANGSGVLPPLFSFVGSAAFNFGVTGQVTYNGGGNFYGPEGGVVGTGTDLDSVGGISGIKHSTRIMFLVGAFLDGQEPGGAAPLRLDSTSDGFTDLHPVLNQIFLIGGGLTGIGTGAPQTFYAPLGATRLFFGFGRRV